MVKAREKALQEAERDKLEKVTARELASLLGLPFVVFFIAIGRTIWLWKSC